MLIDILFLLTMIIAVFKGFRKGLIIGLFSIAGWIIGLAAAMKLSTVAAGYLRGSVNIAAKWLPVISFIVVFIVVMLLVRLGAGLLEKTMELSLMGWINRLGGILLYVFLYTLIFSVVLFFAEQLKLIKEDTIASSAMYSWIKPIGPMVIDNFGRIIPIFKDMFAKLQEFFGNVSGHLPE